MASGKHSIVGDLYRKVGEWLGVREEGHADVKEPPRTEEDIRDGEKAIAEMATFQIKLRKAGVTPEDVKAWINEDRRM